MKPAAIPWSHDFRADYWPLSLSHGRFPDIPWIGPTAADQRMRHEIIECLGLQKAMAFCSGLALAIRVFRPA